MPDAWLVVTVCTNRRPEAVAETLRALERQLAKAPDASGLVVSSPGGHHAELVELATELGFEAARAGEPGLAAARNRALELVEGDRVIAFVDDDAIPAPDWLERLSARWREAPPELACIGRGGPAGGGPSRPVGRTRRGAE